MNKKYIILLTTVSLLLGSCKDFLNIEPSNSTESSVTIKTLADAKVMTNGMLRSMINSSYYGRNMMLYADARGGDLTILSQGRGLEALYVFNHSENTNNFSGFWSVGYNVLLQANNILKSIEGLEASGTTLNFADFKGQALTTRALVHFDLVRLYGKTYTEDKASYGVPIVTSTLDASVQPLRNTVEETYAQIIKDLVDAESLLSKTKTKGYINYFANKALQSRVYLTMGDFDKAFAAAEEVITTGGYSLYSNTEWASSWATQFGKESIFELMLAKDQGDLGSGSLGFYYLKNKDNNALGNFSASDYFVNRLAADKDDVRLKLFTTDELGRNAACYKYVGGVTKPGDGKDSYTAVNIKVIRLSELYLTAAEAALKKSNPDKEKAVTYLNAIRKRAPNLAAATAATITEDMVLDERSKELYAEGHRFWDMIRTNKKITFNDEHVGVSLTHRTKIIDRTFFKTILPISFTEINANPAIKAQQNPGYTN